MDRYKNKIVAAKPYIPAEDIEDIQASIADILQSGRLILGHYTQQFEQAFKSYVGTEHAVAVSTCTAAIQITLRYFQVRGREVLIPTNNFIGVASAIIEEGATPVFADMNPENFCVDTEDLLSKITPATAGIILVDIAGQIVPDIDRIRKICEDRGIFLLEDASHAHGAEMNGRKAGNLSEVACFSFYPTKIMTTGTGGMLTTRNEKLAEYARSVRHHGVGGSLEDVVNLGNDWCLSEINATLGLFQLKHLDENVTHRNNMITRYRKGLRNLPWLRIPQDMNKFRHAYYKFPVLIRDGLDRDKFRQLLFEKYNIESGAIYDPPCHLQPVLRRKYGYHEGMFPKAESTLKQQFCPPVHSSITTLEVDSVIEAMILAGKECGFT